MLKKVLAASALMAIAGSSIVYAQRAGGPGGPDGPNGPRRDMQRPQMQRPQFTPEDMSAFADARIAAIKVGLKLTADQEKNWPAFETAYRNIAKLRADRVAARMEEWKKRRETRDQDQNAAPPDRDANMMERMQRRADAMSKGATAFKQLTDAAAPLYQSLDEGQKRRFTFLARFMNRPARFAMEDRGRFEHRGPHGFDRFERGGRPRFGAAEGMENSEFAANAPARPDLTGLVDDESAN
jgi:zinc resistance-associated protein